MSGKLVQRFAERVRERPDHPAVAGSAWRPTYAELDAAADGIARDLTGPRGGRVAILMRHDAPLIAAVLGVLKAGRAAVVLSTADPPERHAQICDQIEPERLLTDAPRRGPQEAAGHPSSRDEELAFVIFTSGSTGRPKGVMQTHRTVLHNVERQTTALGIGADDRIALLGSVSGGQGLATTWIALLNGATLCPFSLDEQGLAGLADWIDRERISVVTMSASLFRAFAKILGARRLPGVRLLRLASEMALEADFEAYRRHFPNARLVSAYSASETGNIACAFVRHESEAVAGRLPVGRPVDGIAVTLEDGEIVVRGEYLSPGYWRDPALTAERFGDGRFRTGDLGTLAPDGGLIVTGRRDHQVKINGQRVELSEVEAALAAQPDVAAAAVSPRTAANGDARLTAFVAPRGDRAPTVAGLRRALERRLPRHAVPTELVLVDALPLTPTGKVDRARLAALMPAPTPARPAPAADGGVEAAVVAVWSRAFDGVELGPDDDFFELGGDSLTAAVIAAGIHAALDVDLDLDVIAASPTPAALAARVERLRSNGRAAAASPGLQPADRSRPLPASFEQERIWGESATPEDSLRWTVALALRIVGPLDVERLRGSLEDLVARHEVLRTTYAERDGRVWQVVHPPVRLDLEPQLVSSADEAAEILRAEARTPFDLEREPPLRLRLLRIAEEDHQLLRINHHINSDGRSWDILFDQLAHAYEGRATPEPVLQYADFAVWERGRGFAAEKEWWREQFSAPGRAAVLPFGPPPAGRAYAPEEGAAWELVPRELSAELERLGRDCATTFFVVRLAAFAAQLALESDADDVLLGTFVTGRVRAGLLETFGPFMKHTTLRLRFTGARGFTDWMAAVHDTVIDTTANTEGPFDRICRELNAEGSPPLSTCAGFAVSDEMPQRRFGGLELSPVPRAPETMPAGFGFHVDRGADGDRCLAVFDAHAYDPPEVKAFLARHVRLLAALAADPRRPLAELRHDL